MTADQAEQIIVLLASIKVGMHFILWTIGISAGVIVGTMYGTRG